MSSHTPVYAHDLSDLRWLAVKAASASSGTLKGKSGVRLEDGLLVVPNLDLSSGAVEVEIAGPGPCYPGIAFRLADPLNFELAYSQPHTSGLWDALQYDPVFHGSNCWQAFHGLAFQKKASVPTGEWYSFRVEFQGDMAWVSVGDQPPLLISHLARPVGSGSVGLWTYRPAYFRDLRVYSAPVSEPPSSESEASFPPLPSGTVTEWFAEGYGVVATEPHGILLLNRYFPLALREVVLARRFVLERAAEVKMAFGFSDEADVTVDGQSVFAGTHTFKPSQDRAGRGYIQHGAHKASRKLPAGEHHLAVKVRNSEPFGWGLAFSIVAEDLKLVPAANL